VAVFPSLIRAGGLEIYGNVAAFLDLTTAFPLLEEVGVPLIPAYTPADEALVFTGNVLLENDADIVAFGAGFYDAIHGDLEIAEDAPGSITSLAPLRTLNYVSGDFDFHDVTGVTTLAGLDALVWVDGDVKFRNLPSGLTVGETPSGCRWLKHVGGNVVFDNIAGLTVSADAFPTFVEAEEIHVLNCNGGAFGGFSQCTSLQRVFIDSNVSVNVSFLLNRLPALSNASSSGLAALEVTNNSGNFTQSFQRCATVGNGGILFDGSTASSIDQTFSVLSDADSIVFKDMPNLSAMDRSFQSLVSLSDPAAEITFEDLPSLTAEGLSLSFASLVNPQNLTFRRVLLDKFGADDPLVDSTEQPFRKMTSLRTLTVDDCDSLTWIRGLQTLIGSQVTPGPVAFTGNGNLPTAAQVAAFGAHLTSTGYVGTFTNTGNGPG
jgi:hypothetical protein